MRDDYHRRAKRTIEPLETLRVAIEHFGGRANTIDSCFFAIVGPLTDARQQFDADWVTSDFSTPALTVYPSNIRFAAALEQVDELEVWRESNALAVGERLPPDSVTILAAAVARLREY